MQYLATAKMTVSKSSQRKTRRKVRKEKGKKDDKKDKESKPRELRNSAQQLERAIANGKIKEALNAIDKYKDQMLIYGVDMSVTNILRPKQKSNSPSVYEIIVEAAELSELKYSYAPTDDDIKFMVILLYYCLQNMSIDDEAPTRDVVEDFEMAIDLVEQLMNELAIPDDGD